MWSLDQANEAVVSRVVGGLTSYLKPHSTNQAPNPGQPPLPAVVLDTWQRIKEAADAMEDLYGPPDGPGPDVAVFASGSAARLDFTFRHIQTKQRITKKDRSDLDLLVVTEDPFRLRPTYAEVVEELKEKEFDFDGWADPTKHKAGPKPGYKSTEKLVGTRAAQPKAWLNSIRAESKHLETYRHWLMFESVCLYSRPRAYVTKIASRLENRLFGVEHAQARTRFAMGAYYSACRYLSSIYLDTLREVYPKISKKKLVELRKLKTVRMLNWAALVLRYMAAHMISRCEGNDSVWDVEVRTWLALPSIVSCCALLEEAGRVLPAQGRSNALCFTDGGRSDEDQWRRLRDEFRNESARTLSKLLDDYGRYRARCLDKREVTCPGDSDQTAIYDILEGTAMPCSDDCGCKESCPITEVIVGATKLYRDVSNLAYGATGYAPYSLL